jgi:hypothetical protein
MTRGAAPEFGSVPEDSVMSIPHGPIDLALAALLSLLLATLTISVAVT